MPNHSPQRPTLNILGAGKLGRCLGRLWHEQGVVRIQGVLNRQLPHAEQAVAFIGAGEACNVFGALHAADLHLLSCPDDHIEDLACALQSSRLLRPDDIVFHCSGALPADILDIVLGSGASIASVHPIRSFADPERAAQAFSGTYCGIDGDLEAERLLRPMFEAIGARLVRIDGERKTLYHAAAVFASNYLVTLADTAVALYAAAGIEETVALDMLQPLMQGTLTNVLEQGAQKALTGPIQRGDLTTVARQSQALTAWSPDTGHLYDTLARATSKLADRAKAALGD